MQDFIKLNDMTEVGYVKKTHGVQGELFLILDPEVAPEIEMFEFLFFIVDGLPVPFRVETVSTIGDDFAHVRFRHIQSKEQAQQFVGSKIMVNFPETDNNTFTLDRLVGFQLSDTLLGTIGNIKAIDDYGGNLVMTVEYQQQEVLIPFNEELVVNFNIENRVILMDLPSGLIE